MLAARNSKDGNPNLSETNCFAMLAARNSKDGNPEAPWRETQGNHLERNCFAMLAARNGKFGSGITRRQTLRLERSTAKTATRKNPETNNPFASLRALNSKDSNWKHPETNWGMGEHPKTNGPFALLRALNSKDGSGRTRRQTEGWGSTRRETTLSLRSGRSTAKTATRRETASDFN